MRTNKVAVILAFMIAWPCLRKTHAQSFYNQGSTVSVVGGTVFSVKDSLVNTGTFLNNGNLIIGGTWLNTGTYDPGLGEITFNSASSIPQIINHSNQSFSKLTISGGGKKLILADITIEDEIVLTDGVIERENDARVIIKPGVTVSGGSDFSHIHAPVYHMGDGKKYYPLGDGSVYLPVILEDITDPAAVIGIETIAVDASPLMKAPSLDAISAHRYWHIDAVGGAVQSRITLPLKDENFTNPEQIVVAESPAPDENFETIGQSLFQGTATSGRVTSDRQVTGRFVTVASSSHEGGLLVYNAVSPNDDGLNDFLRILNIEIYPENKFMLFNRWGDKIFEMENYDNQERVFRGRTNVNGEKDLVNGTYFYVIETKKDALRLNGFLVLKH